MLFLSRGWGARTTARLGCSVPSKFFTYAGTKDKRGITVQRMTVFRTPPQKLARLNQRLPGIRVGNFG